MDNVIVVRNLALPVSETFIATQIQAMRTYQPILFCQRRMNSDTFHLPTTVSVLQKGTAREKIDNRRYAIGLGSSSFDNAVNTYNPALIHAHGGTEGILAVRTKQKHNLPLVTTFHGFDATGSSHPIGIKGKFISASHSYHRKLLKEHGDLFIAVSEEIKSHLIKQGFPEERVKVVHLGVNLSALSSIPSTPEQRSKNIVTVGRFVEKKGTTDLIAAFAKIRNAHPEYRLDIVGDGPLRESVVAAIHRHGVQDAVTLHGALHFEETHRLIAKSQVFALPSKRAANGDKEGLPIAILEAMALGTPVVSTYHSGIPEAVIDGQSGLLVKEGDIDSLATALSQIIESQALWNAFHDSGRQRVEESFDTHKQTRLLEDIFTDLIST